MSRVNGDRVQVPPDLREVLLEFTINYLLEQPADVVAYAADYFQRLRDNRCTLIYDVSTGDGAYSPTGSAASQEDEAPPAFSDRRRKSVFAEAYNPEDDDDDDDVDKVVFPKSDEQRQQLSQKLCNILLFRSLEKEQMQEVLDAMFEQVVEPGEVIIRQGDDGDNFYVIQNGVYEAYVHNEGEESKPIHTYNNCGSFGELSLLYNTSRAATIKAVTNGSLWAMDRQTFRRIVLKSAYKKRKTYETLIESVHILKELTPYERMNLADALITKTYAKGDEIIRQGDSADGMYLVEQGSVAITVLDENNQQVKINDINKGGYFGELALVTHRTRAASAFAQEDVKCAFVDVEAFERILGPCMQVMKRNITDYNEQINKIFGSKQEMKDLR